MSDINKLIKYCILISKQRIVGVDTPKDALLGLLRKYIKKNSKDSRKYKNYLKQKITELENLADSSLCHYIATLDDDITTPENRVANKITKQHDTQGSFEALLIAFILSYPKVFQQIANDYPEPTVISSCYERAQLFKQQSKLVGGDTTLLGINLWQIIFQFLSSKDIVNYSKTGRYAYRLLEGARNASRARYDLLKAVENQDHERAKKLVQLNAGSIIDPVFVREKSVLFIASWDQDEEMFWILAKPFMDKIDENADVTKFLMFHYLVMGGQRIRAERYIEALSFDKRKAFILKPGPHGFSAMEITEIELNDIPMRTRLLRQLTHDPEWLIGEQVKIYQDDVGYSTHREKWLAYVNLLQENLDEELKALATHQIERIKHSPELAKQKDNYIAQYKNAYQQAINGYAQHRRFKGDRVLVLGVGLLMRKLARHMLYEYFRPQRPFYNPDQQTTHDRLAGCAYECDLQELTFQFHNGAQLFDQFYSSLGRKVYIHRGEFEALSVCLIYLTPSYIDGRTVRLCREVLDVVTREFELKVQMSEELCSAMQPKIRLASQP